MKDKKSKVIIITGASSGIGAATADYLANLGHKVYGLSRSTGTNPKVQYVKCDVTSLVSIEQAFSMIIIREGHIDVVVNNAGMGVSGAVEYSTEQDYNSIMDVNVKGLIQVSQRALPYLRSEQGMLINISSVAGILAIPFQAYYSLTKAAVIQFSKALELEVRPFGVRVACVLPGDTKTNFTQNRHQPSVLIDDVYQERIKRSLEKMEKDEQQGVSPLKVAKTIAHTIQKKHPAMINVVGSSYRLLVWLSRWLPERLVQWILYQMYAK